jgi:hypothetical protein
MGTSVKRSVKITQLLCGLNVHTAVKKFQHGLPNAHISNGILHDESVLLRWVDPTLLPRRYLRCCRSTIIGKQLMGDDIEQLSGSNRNLIFFPRKAHDNNLVSVY